MIIVYRGIHWKCLDTLQHSPPPSQRPLHQRLLIYPLGYQLHSSHQSSSLLTETWKNGEAIDSRFSFLHVSSVFIHFSKINPCIFCHFYFFLCHLNIMPALFFFSQAGLSFMVTAFYFYFPLDSSHISSLQQKRS